MRKIKAHIQKQIFEIRFPARTAMFALGGQLADRWITDYPEAKVELPRFAVTNPGKHRTIAFGINNAVVDFEERPDMIEFVKTAQAVASDVAEIVAPVRIDRLGFRTYHLLTGPSFSEALAATKSLLAPMSPDAMNDLSDIGIVLDFNAREGVSGKVHFGPWHKTNTVNFSFPAAPSIKNLEGGFLFDIDYGEINANPDALDQDRIQDWLYSAATINGERLKHILGALGTGVE